MPSHQFPVLVAVVVTAVLDSVVVAVTVPVFAVLDVTTVDVADEVGVDVVVNLAQDARRSDVTIRQVSSTQIALLFIYTVVPPILFRDFWKTGYKLFFCNF
jgi:anti-anti-sigma regulatory factor